MRKTGYRPLCITKMAQNFMYIYPESECLTKLFATVVGYKDMYMRQMKCQFFNLWNVKPFMKLCY